MRLPWKKARFDFKDLDRIDPDKNLRGYTHHEVEALIAPIFGLTAEDMCGIILIGVRHHKEGHHSAHTVTDLPSDLTIALLRRVLVKVSLEGSDDNA